jgi:hypothetical protein
MILGLFTGNGKTACDCNDNKDLNDFGRVLFQDSHNLYEETCTFALDVARISVKTKHFGRKNLGAWPNLGGDSRILI